MYHCEHDGGYGGMMKKVIGIVILVLLLLSLVACTADSPGYIRVIDSDDDMLAINEDSGAIITFAYPHFAVHEGESFLVIAVDTVLDDGDLIILVFKTMLEAERAHMFMQFSTLVGGYVTVWEGVTWTTGSGGLNPIINRNREAGLAFSGLLEDLTATPAFTATNNILEKVAGLNTAGATDIYNVYAWGKKEKLMPGDVYDVQGFALKPDTQYAVVFTAVGAANKAQMILEWIEQPQ